MSTASSPPPSTAPGPRLAIPLLRRPWNADGEPRPGRARRVISAAVASGALVPLALTHSDASAGGSWGNWSVAYPTDRWARFELPLTTSVVALLAAAAFLWVARGRLVVTAASFASAAVAVASVALVLGGPPEPDAVSPAAYRSLTIGTPEAVVRARLRRPAATGSASRLGSGSIPCLVYDVIASAHGVTNGDPETTGLGASSYVFCFAHGRMLQKLAW